MGGGLTLWHRRAENGTKGVFRQRTNFHILVEYGCQPVCHRHRCYCLLQASYQGMDVRDVTAAACAPVHRIRIMVDHDYPFASCDRNHINTLIKCLILWPPTLIDPNLIYVGRIYGVRRKSKRVIRVVGTIRSVPCSSASYSSSPCHVSFSSSY